MTISILRRRKLGKGSCNGIAGFSKNPVTTVRNWIDDVPVDTNLIIRWGCTSNVPRGMNVLQPAEAIHKVSDKSGFRRFLMENAPETIPRTYFHPNELEYPLRVPVVVRRSPHHQGRYLHLCENEAAVRAACALYGDYYISDYIPKVAEYRVCFVQGLVAWVAQKTPADPAAIAWNVAQGGRFDNVRWKEWPIEAIKTSKKAFDLSGLDFGGVDVMVDADNNSYVLEINSAPSLTSPYRQECMAKCFDYILENGKEPIPLNENYNKYLRYIHPAVNN